MPGETYNIKVDVLETTTIIPEVYIPENIARTASITTALNRSTAVNIADTNYTTLMARGSSLNNT